MGVPSEAAVGCYRLEYSWSPGVMYMPGRVELTNSEAEGRPGQSVYSIVVAADATSQLHESIWAAPAADSVWLRLVSGPERDAFTVRAERTGADWVGEGRVYTPGGPVSAGQNRGGVRLTRTSCAGG
jgi:hypothetical protein